MKVSPEIIGENGLNVFNCELAGEGVSASALVNVFQPDDADAFLQEALR